MIKRLLPKNKSGWIIFSGFLLSFLADVAHDNYSFDPINATPRVALIEWLIRVVRDWALTAAIATMVIAGLRIIREEGLTLKRLIMPFVGICIASGCLWVSFYGYQTFSTLPDLHRTPEAIRRKLEANINSGTIGPEQKAKRSKFYAYMRFQEDGVQTKYFAPDGKEELYNPTEKEKYDRYDPIKTQKLLKWMARSLYLSIYFWVVVIVVSLAVGLLTPVKKEHPTPG